MTTETNKRETRVLLYMPTGRDAELVATILQQNGMPSHPCESSARLVDEIHAGAGAVLVAEEALEGGAIADLIGEIEAQPVWSDLPVIVFSSSGRNAEALLVDLGSKINVIVVERPIRITMLLSAVRGALRARQRQYQTRDLLSQLREADKQKDLFLATLSHELRTPLNSILGWIQILRHGKGTVDVDHAIEIIDRNAKSQAEMIADILFLSRVITGKLELKHETVEIADVLTHAVEIIRPAAESKGITLNNPDDCRGVRVDADVERMGQVFLNLLSNAVKFTSDGGRIDITTTCSGPTIEVCVADNGQGIDPEFLPHIFERFRQADNTYTRRAGGLGLGLAIVRHLVELHGGSVRAESDGDGSGAAFFVTLPKARETVASREKTLDTTGPAARPRRALEGLRVLVVEDDADSREMLTTVLKYQGADTVAAKTAFEGLEMLKEFRPDVLVSDIGLPKEDGYDLIRKVRKLPKDVGGSTPAIALTGYVSLQDRQTALFSGFEEHMPKPIDTERLIDVILRLRRGHGE